MGKTYNDALNRYEEYLGAIAGLNPAPVPSENERTGYFLATIAAKVDTLTPLYLYGSSGALFTDAECTEPVENTFSHTELLFMADNVIIEANTDSMRPVCISDGEETLTFVCVVVSSGALTADTYVADWSEPEGGDE